MAIAMTSKQYVDTLKHIASDCKTVYKNKFPYNLGYYDAKSGKYSFDCWNLVKSVINGWQDCKIDGYYVKGFKYTGDLNGQQILNKCTTKSKDFSKLSVPGTYLYLPGHAGSYIGEVVINGKYYNVIECTGSWTKNVLYSWVDKDGTRRNFKGGSKNSRWTDWGLMCWLDYSGVTPAPTPTPQPTPTPTPQPSGFILGKYYYTSPIDKKKIDMGYVFNPTYYADHYKDLKDAFGYNDKKLFDHFCKYGMNEFIEGNDYYPRQAIANFNCKAYMKNYPQLVKEYGTNYSYYYEHYCRFGYAQGWKAT